MDIIPAIDLRGGKCVRLTQGDYSREKVYSSDPLTVADGFRRQGATRLHIVDLDGARAGVPRYLDVARRIVEGTGLKVEYGGGIRKVDIIGRLLDCGVRKAIIGTAAFKSDEFLSEALAKYGDAVIVSADARAGMIRTEGWLSGVDLKLEDAVSRLVEKGVMGIIYTDTERDGTLEGVDTSRLATVLKLAGGIEVQMAGGVKDLNDIIRLKEMSGLTGVIVGKAIYEGTLDLAAALAATK